MTGVVNLDDRRWFADNSDRSFRIRPSTAAEASSWPTSPGPGVTPKTIVKRDGSGPTLLGTRHLDDLADSDDVELAALIEAP